MKYIDALKGNKIYFNIYQTIYWPNLGNEKSRFIDPRHSFNVQMLKTLFNIYSMENNLSLQLTCLSYS